MKGLPPGIRSRTGTYLGCGWYVVVCAAPSTGLCEGVCPNLLLLSRGFLFFPSSRSVVLTGQARKGLSLLLSHVKPCGLSYLLCLFKILTVFNKEGLMNFIQYKIKMVTSYCCLLCEFHGS